MQPEFRQVPLAQLRVSATLSQIERRQHLDKGAINELAESLSTVGMLQPLVVRQIPGGNAHGDTFEIVAGERRFLAAKLAKLDAVPVSVRELTDEQVQEVQLVENLQRADVHPMAEAEGYEALYKLSRTVDEIADKVGKSKAYVYSRMKLLELCKAGRTAFYEGTLDASKALLVARIAGEEHQERALKVITEVNSWNGRSMSYRECFEHVRDNFMLKLSDAPFPREDATLVPSAGACGACPMRTGNQPELFGDVKGADVCTSPACFQQKKAAHVKRELDKAKATGERVIRGADAKRILPDSRYSVGGEKTLRNGYARPSDKCQNDPKKRTWRELAGKDAPTVLLQHPTGRIEKVFEISAIKDLVRAKGITPPKKAENREEARTQDHAQRELNEKAERTRRAAVFNAARAAAPRKLDRTLIVELLTNELDNSSYGDDMWTLLDWKKPAPKADDKKYIRTMLSALPDADLAQLAAVATLIDEATESWGKAEDLERVASGLGVDVKKVRAAAVVTPPVTAEPKASKKGKAAAPAKVAKKKGKK